MPLVCEEYPESLAPSRGAVRYRSSALGGFELVVARRLASFRVLGLTELLSLS